MELPKTSNLLLPILKLLSDKDTYRLKQIVHSLAETYQGDSDETQFYNHVAEARSHLIHANLIKSPRQGISVISERGMELLAKKPETLTVEELTRYPEFEDEIEERPILGGNRTAPLNNSTLSNGFDADMAPPYMPDNSAAVRAQMQLAQHTTPRPQPNPSTSIGRNTVMVSKESFSSTLELFEQLKVSSQMNQVAPAAQIPVDESAKGLNPALFALISVLRFLENLFQNIWLYLIPFLLMMLAYGASFFVLSDEYASRGVMFVQHDTLINQVSSIGADNFSFFLSPSEQTTEEIQELLNTDSFIRLIIEQTPLEEKMDDGSKTVQETISDVRGAIYVGITGSNNVEVKATWDDRAVAWKMAEATLDSFIEWKINSQKRDSLAAREFLEQLVPQYENERLAAVQELEAYLIQHPEPFRGDRPEIEVLQIEQLRQAVETADERYQEAANNLEQIRLEEVIVEGKTRQAYEIIDSPEIPIDEEGGLIKKIGTAAIFITLGIIFSLLAVVVTTILDRSIRFPIETPSAIGLPVLSSVKMVPHIDQVVAE